MLGTDKVVADAIWRFVEMFIMALNEFEEMHLCLVGIDGSSPSVTVGDKRFQHL